MHRATPGDCMVLSQHRKKVPPNRSARSIGVHLRFRNSLLGRISYAATRAEPPRRSDSVLFRRHAAPPPHRPLNPANASTGRVAYPSVQRRFLRGLVGMEPVRSAWHRRPSAPRTSCPAAPRYAAAPHPRTEHRGPARVRPAPPRGRRCERLQAVRPGGTPKPDPAVRRRPRARRPPEDAGPDRPVSGRPGRGPARSRIRCQIASTNAPPVSTGAHGGFRRLVPAGVGVPEQPAVAVIAIALGRRAVGDQHVMRIQFQMKYRYFLRSVVPQDRAVVHQEFHRDQHAIEIKRMPLGDVQVTVRDVVRQGALAHDHRRRRAAPSARRQRSALADPAQRPRAAAQR